MNPANRITLGRILLTPFFFLIFYLSYSADRVTFSLSLLLWIVFALSELSDVADGWVARRFGFVSDVGKLADPFSDVLSRVTFFFCFTLAGVMPAPAFVVILWRELGMTFFRMLMLMRGGKALAASWSGKMKAVLYFLAALGGMWAFTKTQFCVVYPVFAHALTTLFYLAAAASLLSFFHYLYKNRSVFG